MIGPIEFRTILLAVFGLLVLVLAIRSLRAMRLNERHTLLFLFIGLPFLGLAVWPDAVVFFADRLRIEKATFMTFCLAAFTILMLLKLLSVISVQDRKIQSLAQMVGILLEKEKQRFHPRPPTTQARREKVRQLRAQLRQMQALDLDEADLLADADDAPSAVPDHEPDLTGATANASRRDSRTLTR
ncbi:MAG: DUF2304 domain-containing protein [Phycisphaeraceae bacterium]